MDSVVVIRKKKRDKHFEQRAEIGGPRAEERHGLRKIRTHHFHYDLLHNLIKTDMLVILLIF